MNEFVVRNTVYGIPVQLHHYNTKVEKSLYQNNKSLNCQLKMAILLLLLGFTVSQAQDCAVKYDSIEKRSYYILTDKMPTYTGGFENLKKTINKNLKWPGPRCCLDGAVYVSFVVEPDGRRTNRKVAKGLSNQPVCDADREALRVLTFLDGWIPGECDGKSVPVEVIIPIKFSL